MALFQSALFVCFMYQQLVSALSVCLSGCSCTNEAFGRSLLCMALSLERIPQNIPENLVKIRIEKSHLTEIPQAAFTKSRALTSLWLNFNDITLMNIRCLEGLYNLTELRMQDNKLRSIPWTAFQETPNLQILDLKHNRLDVLPENALRHLPALTYLDLSFNQLTIISRDVFLNWPRLRSQTSSTTEEQTHTVLAVHENRWLCDCRLKGFVEFINTISPPLILMNSDITCSGPESTAGTFFHEVQLKTCLKPETSSPQTNITLPLGSNVTLTCQVKSNPESVIRWSYRLKRIRGFTVSQVQVSEDTVSSALFIPSLHVADRGLYSCTANNFLGNSSVSILLDVQTHNSSFPLSPAFPLASVNVNEHIDIQISKQTVCGINIEWFALIENPAETWFTVYFGRYDAPKAIHLSPGTNSYSVSNLLPLTKYEVCVTVKNHLPRDEECDVFVTGNDVKEPDQRERLIHIMVIVCVMVLAVPAGMFVCTADSSIRYCECCTRLHRRRRKQEMHLKPDERHRSFDTLQTGSDEKLCRDSVEERKMKRRSEDKTQKGNSAQLY